MNIHLLFELFPYALIIARYRWCVGHSPPMTSADIKQLSRHLSQIVYLVLYSVIAFREIIGLFNGIWHGGDDDALVVLACGLLALFGVRVLAYRLWLRSTAARRNSIPR
jgi:cytochrome b561